MLLWSLSVLQTWARLPRSLSGRQPLTASDNESQVCDHHTGVVRYIGVCDVEDGEGCGLLGISGAWERLYSAIGDALLWNGPIQERVATCYPNFHENTLRQELPVDLLTRFDTLMAACTRETDPADMHGPFEVTTKDMDSAEGRKWLEELLNLYDEVTKRNAVEWERTKGTSQSRTEYSFS